MAPECSNRKVVGSFFAPLHRNDGELIASFHRQIIGLGCCLFDPDFCPMTGFGQDSNQHIGRDPVGIPVRNRRCPRSRCACALCNRGMGQPPGLNDLGQGNGEFRPKKSISAVSADDKPRACPGSLADRTVTRLVVLVVAIGEIAASRKA